VDAVLPFWVSIACLSLVQGVLVLVPAPRPFPVLDRFRSRWWAVIPAASVAAVVAAVSATGTIAQALTYLALVGVPALAVVALARGVRGHAPALAAAVVGLFALAWAARASLAGEAAALILSALSCVTLGGLLAAVAPARWLKAGILAMAVVDAALVAADLLQAPNQVLSAAAPAAGLPRLQSVLLGSAQMGYGDLFIAAALGALLAAQRPVQRRAAALTAGLAMAFDLLFLAVPELPATVPVALALVVLESAARRHRVAAAAATDRPGARLSAGGRAPAGRRPPA
jgi:hypothetical protein